MFIIILIYSPSIEGVKREGERRKKWKRKGREMITQPPSCGQKTRDRRRKKLN